MNGSSLPPDSQIFEAIYEVHRRMGIIAEVLKDRIPLCSDANDMIELSAVRVQMLATVAVLNILDGREFFRGDGSQPIWETC